MIHIIQNFRKTRAKLFLAKLKPKNNYKILDLGGGNGEYINQIFKNLNLKNLKITVTDLNNEHLNVGKGKYAMKFQKIDVTDRLPFKSKSFDIVFCNSLIEHATGKKEDVFGIRDNSIFDKHSFKYQKKLSREIQRVGKSYFVQTPNKTFPIESHTLMPYLIIYLPRYIQILIIKFIRDMGLRDAVPDWHLLTKKDMHSLFPDAQIIEEKYLGFVKSLIAVKQ